MELVEVDQLRLIAAYGLRKQIRATVGGRGLDGTLARSLALLRIHPCIRFRKLQPLVAQQECQVPDALRGLPLDDLEGRGEESRRRW